MSAATASDQVRRLVYIGEAIESGAETLALMRSMAVQLHAELAAMFIEDLTLLRAAALPVTREVGLVSGTVRSFDVDSVERLLRLQAEQLRSQLIAMATELQLPWTFDIARGHLAEQVLKLATSADAVLIGGRRRRRIPPAAFLQRARARTIVAIYEPDVVGARVLSAAWGLAERRTEGLQLLIPTTSGTFLERIRAQIAQRLEVPKEALNVRMYPGAICDLPRLMAGGRASALVLPKSGLRDAELELRALLESLDYALVLVS